LVLMGIGEFKVWHREYPCILGYPWIFPVNSKA